MGRGNLLEWFIYCIPSQALKGRHIHPLLSVCVENRPSHALLLKPGHVSKGFFTVKEITFVVCGVLGSMQESWEREQEGCQIVFFRGVSEWLSFPPPGNFYFRVKDAPLLTELRKIGTYYRQHCVT